VQGLLILEFNAGLAGVKGAGIICRVQSVEVAGAERTNVANGMRSVLPVGIVPNKPRLKIDAGVAGRNQKSRCRSSESAR